MVTPHPIILPLPPAPIAQPGRLPARPFQHPHLQDRGCHLSGCCGGLQLGDQATWLLDKSCFCGLFRPQPPDRAKLTNSQQVQTFPYPTTQTLAHSSFLLYLSNHQPFFSLGFSPTDWWGSFPWEFRGPLVPRILLLCFGSRHLYTKHSVQIH